MGIVYAVIGVCSVAGIAYVAVLLRDIRAELKFHSSLQDELAHLRDVLQNRAELGQTSLHSPAQPTRPIKILKKVPYEDRYEYHADRANATDEDIKIALALPGYAVEYPDGKIEYGNQKPIKPKKPWWKWRE